MGVAEPLPNLPNSAPRSRAVIAVLARKACTPKLACSWVSGQLVLPYPPRFFRARNSGTSASSPWLARECNLKRLKEKISLPSGRTATGSHVKHGNSVSSLLSMLVMMVFVVIV